MSQRVYTLLTPDQKKAVEDRAASEDRSESKIISRALDRHLESVTPNASPVTGATIKTFTRTSPDIARRVKEIADHFQCQEWRVVNAAVSAYLETENV